MMYIMETGHNRLNAHMDPKFKLAPSPTCSCGQEDQTAEHILTVLSPLPCRAILWPTATPLTTKHFGWRQELEQDISYHQSWSDYLTLNSKRKKMQTVLQFFLMQTVLQFFLGRRCGLTIVLNHSFVARIMSKKFSQSVSAYLCGRSLLICF